MPPFLSLAKPSAGRQNHFYNGPDNLVNKYFTNGKKMVQPDPVAILTAYMEEHGEGQSELAMILGSPAAASLLLNRKRPLSLDQIRKLKQAWPELDANELIREYPIER